MTVNEATLVLKNSRDVFLSQVPAIIESPRLLEVRIALIERAYTNSLALRTVCEAEMPIIFYQAHKVLKESIS